MCGDFKRGNCTRGDRCRFSHGDAGGGGGTEKGKDGGKGKGKGDGGGKGKSEGGGDSRPGDWTCPGCGMMVFASKSECFKCHTTRDGTKGTGDGEAGPKPDKYSDALWEKPRGEINLPLIGEMCNGAARWTYVLNDESRRSFAAFLPSPFVGDQTKKLFEDARVGTAWKQPEGPRGPIPRKTAWMVAPGGCNCTYRYGRIEVDPEVYPPWMHDIMRMVMPICGLSDPSSWPDCCNVNLYEDGGMSVGWHADDESLFQGKFTDIRIISLSLGVKRKFELRANWPDDNEKATRTVMLGDGDLMTMEGMTQKHFMHRVPKEGHVEGQRINFTWRWVLKHAPRCPACRRR